MCFYLAFLSFHEGIFFVEFTYALACLAIQELIAFQKKNIPERVKEYGSQVLENKRTITL